MDKKKKDWLKIVSIFLAIFFFIFLVLGSISFSETIEELEKTNQSLEEIEFDLDVSQQRLQIWMTDYKVVANACSDAGFTPCEVLFNEQGQVAIFDSNGNAVILDL